MKYFVIFILTLFTACSKDEQVEKIINKYADAVYSNSLDSLREDLHTNFKITSFNKSLYNFNKHEVLLYNYDGDSIIQVIIKFVDSHSHEAYHYLNLYRKNNQVFKIRGILVKSTTMPIGFTDDIINNLNLLEENTNKFSSKILQSYDSTHEYYHYWEYFIQKQYTQDLKNSIHDKKYHPNIPELDDEKVEIIHYVEGNIFNLTNRNQFFPLNESNIQLAVVIKITIPNINLHSGFITLFYNKYNNNYSLVHMSTDYYYPCFMPRNMLYQIYPESKDIDGKMTDHTCSIQDVNFKLKEIPFKVLKLCSTDSLKNSSSPPYCLTCSS